MKLTFDRRGMVAMLALGVLLLTLLPGCGEEEQTAAAPTEVKVAEALQKDVPVSRE